jgi:hypothetical protein
MGPKISEARRGSVSFRSVTTVGGMSSLEASGGPERTSFPLVEARSKVRRPKRPELTILTILAEGSEP